MRIFKQCVKCDMLPIIKYVWQLVDSIIITAIKKLNSLSTPNYL